MNIEAVLFDLDNTLILFDEKEFYKKYVYKLSQHFQDILSREEFERKLMASTQIMSNNDGKLTNAEYFINHFSIGLTINKTMLWNTFKDFYLNHFAGFKKLMKPIDGVRDLILRLQKLKLKIVIASNPMLPENVQQMRLDWAGLNGIEFDLITHAENFKYCKPNIYYYQEICKTISVKPQKCIMVGNDLLNDMIAGKTGMITFYVKHEKNNSVEVSREITGLNNIEIYEPDYCGLLPDLRPILKTLNRN